MAQTHPLNSISEVLRHASQQLAPTSSTAHLDAEILLTWILKKKRSFLHGWPETELNSNQLHAFRDLIEQRYLGQPIAYLIGKREFWSLEFDVTPDVLIPRPESELLVELALKIIPGNADWFVADLGTGSGVISVALAHERPGISVHACDICNQALAIAQKNAAKHHASNISFFNSDWFTNLPCTNYQLIISNPPYIDENDPHLLQGDVRFEPITALKSSDSGLNALKRIAHKSRNRLATNGWLILEHGYTQANDLKCILTELGYFKIATFPDLQGHMRATIAQWIPAKPN